MAKNKKTLAKETVEMEKSDEVLTVAKSNKTEKLSKEEKQALKLKKQKAKTKAKNDKPKRNRTKEIVSELKKVNWPSFGKVCKQTGAVLAVVVVFMLAVLGIDTLVAWILNLITKI